VRALRQAAGEREGHIHVQRRHPLLQRWVPPQADAAWRRMWEERSPDAAAVLVPTGVPLWVERIWEVVRRKLTGQSANEMWITVNFGMKISLRRSCTDAAYARRGVASGASTVRRGSKQWRPQLLGWRRPQNQST
jgi:hypothetical protein